MEETIFYFSDRLNNLLGKLKISAEYVKSKNHQKLIINFKLPVMSDLCKIMLDAVRPNRSIRRTVLSGQLAGQLGALIRLKIFFKQLIFLSLKKLFIKINEKI
ncbi:hypothetical protein BpHYR1_044070 [Brachionus plicatilis]|uniref:Uncharacterized protein n=1 Tax=Brachionus plicatilis TaxID=10195 RepID=A0A3M7PGG1_BRAPC|nr:hypothetical protein BpHYR1_044070 [Brachionus plicatilis]